MKKLTSILFVIVGIQALYISYSLIVDHRIEQRVFETMSHHMPYEQFKQMAVNRLSAHDDLISFDIPEDDFFQSILSEPYHYLDNMKRLMADKEVASEVKLGAAATMIALDIPDLANFVNYLNTLSVESSDMYRIANAVAFNTYSGSSFVNKELISGQHLAEHFHKDYVWQVFKNIYENPLLPSDLRNNQNSSLYQIVNSR